MIGKRSVLNFKAETLELIARGETLARVADHICRYAEERFPGVVCSILTVDRGGMIHPLAAPSLPASYLASLDNIAVGPNVGSCGTAAYCGQPVEVHDIADDPRWQGFNEQPLALGLKACWSSPLVDAAGYVIATFALYFQECRGPSRDERNFVELGMHLCDLAISRHSRVEDRERRAALDALTSLPNRGSFERTLAHLSCAIPRSWALFIIDVDNLKMTNDTFGHAAGDRLLQELAARLARCALPDRAFRIGGDEFALLIMAPERLADLEGMAAELLARIAPTIEFASFTLGPTVTIGYAPVMGGEVDASSVYRKADTALYHAKETLVGGYVGFHPALETRILARLSSIEAVEAALQEGRIQAWYQPVIDLRTERIVAFEALCRMMTSQGEVISASVFNEATTDVRIASTLTRHMLMQVAGDMRQWRDLGIPICPIGVNITAIDLRGGRLNEMLDSIFDGDAGLLTKLVLEVTESIYLGKRAHLMTEMIHSLRARGIRIALDDFGTGFASLTHLLNLPIDLIKIDRSFVEGLPHDDLSATIISSVVAIAQKLGANVTAEGVEREDQLARLAGLQCAACQGFLYAPAVPMPEASLLAMRHSAYSDHTTPMPRRVGPTVHQQPTRFEFRQRKTN